MHAPGRKSRFDFFPKHRRKFETHDAVEHTTRLLGIHQVDVDVARILYSMENSILCDFVEDDSLGGFRLKLQHLIQVPGYSLPLAVLIGSEPHHLCLLSFLLKLRHKGLLVIGNLIFRHETVIHVDAEILLPQIADMAVARHHGEVRAEELSDGFRFRG